MNEREALKLALETAEGIVKSDWRKWQELASPDEFERWVKSRALHMATAIKETLAQPEQEPVGEVSKAEFGDYPVICWRKGYVAKIGDKFYTTPPQRTWEKPWVSLTEAEIENLAHYHGIDSLYEPGVKDFYESIADKLKEKNFQKGETD